MATTYYYSCLPLVREPRPLQFSLLPDQKKPIERRKVALERLNPLLERVLPG